MLYAAGFPNWQWHDETQTRINNTRDWGLKAFRLTTGRLAMQLDRPLEEGYQIGYTNNIESGMSGGPILNQHGYLVGINGRLKYPLGGIDTFKFTDGRFPRWSEFKQMEMLSWGIPIETVLGQKTTETGFLSCCLGANGHSPLLIHHRNPVSLLENPFNFDSIAKI